jgi:hypothetical protein
MSLLSMVVWINAFYIIIIIIIIIIITIIIIFAEMDGP